MAKAKKLHASQYKHYSTSCIHFIPKPLETETLLNFPLSAAPVIPKGLSVYIS